MRVSYQPVMVEERPVHSTRMVFTVPPTFPSKFESTLDYEDEKSHENIVEELSILEELKPSLLDYETTYQVLSTTVSTTSSPPQEQRTTSSSTPASLTNIPLHPTHAIHTNHAVHSTHALPSEVQTQTHLDTHRHKGSQTNKK